MKVRLELSTDEVRAVEAILQVLSDRAKRKKPFSLNQLLQEWSRFVSHVEHGYGGSIYEYTNDRSTRDLLEEVLRKVPESLHDRLIEAIRPWDSRFRETTREVKQPLSPSVNFETQSWWWFRVPKNVSAELENDLRSEGILN